MLMLSSSSNPHGFTKNYVLTRLHVDPVGEGVPSFWGVQECFLRGVALGVAIDGGPSAPPAPPAPEGGGGGGAPCVRLRRTVRENIPCIGSH